MVLMIQKEGSFSLTANVTAPGYQSLVLRGYLVERRNGETWVAPLIPQLFYGVTGAQLGPTWRQYLPAAGEQVILSRVGGKPEVPREELFWRRITHVAPVEEAVKLEEIPEEIPLWWVAMSLALGLLPIAVVGFLSLGGGEG